jgi:hypothetical protein
MGWERGSWALELGSEQLGYTLLFAAFVVLGTVTVRNIQGVR